MCDLHRDTTDRPSPPGAIPTQIRWSIERRIRASPGPPPLGFIKLYNAGNFFDAASIPPSDYAEIADLCAPFERVIVENHPRIGRSRHRRWSQHRRSTEIAIGLESVQPGWHDAMDKQTTRDEIDAYAAEVIAGGGTVRCFVIFGYPGQTVAESVRWTRLTVRHAAAIGARHVSIVPARVGEGWNGRGGELPTITPEDCLTVLTSVLGDGDSRDGGPVVTVDTWAMDRCPIVDRIETLSRRQRVWSR